MSASLPASLASQPLVDRWLSFTNRGVVIARTGKVELGQGILTALVQIVAEELGIAACRVELTSGDTRRDPDEAYTGGSFSIEHGGRALTLAAAAAREIFLVEAARCLTCPRASVAANAEGEILKDGQRTDLSYWSLASSVDLQVPVVEFAKPKAADRYTLVGTDFPRIDLRQKFTGNAFIHDLMLPGHAARTCHTKAPHRCDPRTV